MIWKLRAPGETDISSSGTSEAWPVSGHHPLQFSEISMNQIEFIDNLPLEEVQSGLSYPGLITVRRSGVQTLRKRILPTQLVLSSDVWNGVPITRFRKSKYWGPACSSMVEFLPSMQTALGSVPNPAKRKQCNWPCLGEPVNTVTWETLSPWWNHQLLFVQRRGHKCPLCPDLIAERPRNGHQSPGQQLAKVIRQSGRKKSVTVAPHCL